MSAQRNSTKFFAKSTAKFLLFRPDGQARAWVQKALYIVKHFPLLRKIIKKILFKKDGQVRSVFARVYTRLKAAEVAPAPAVSLEAYVRSCLGGRLAAPSVARRCDPKLTVVAMARNEEARAHDVMRHFCALFDRVVVIDHLSEDDTARIVMSYDGVSGTEVVVLRGLDAGYYQSEYMSACANALIRESATDWIFFLDFDEFLLFHDARAFKQALVDLADCPVIQVPWHNIALTRFDPETLQGVTGIIGADSEYVKVAVNVRALGTADITVWQGNHAVCLPGDDAPLAGPRAFGMFHVPILGYEALKAKIGQGVRALKETVGKETIQGFHWHEMSGEMDTLLSNEALVCGIALHYSRPLKEIMAKVAAGNAMEGTRKIVLSFAQSEAAPVLEGALPAAPSFTLDTITEVLSGRFPPAPPQGEKGRLPVPLYRSLPARPARTLPGNAVAEALLAATTDAAVRTPSAKNGHIPFLFALLELSRPRLYVELGADTGASFFAACQHMRANGRYGEAVAVGEWPEGRDARHNEYAFEVFKQLLDAHFSATGKFIRGAADAASVFEEGSIDVLHIKGLAAFEEVQAVYEAWRPKLSADGVILIQNTGEHSAGHGVWQVFESIRNDAAASFQFSYDRGIGILALGTKETNPALSLIEDFHSRPEKMELYFSSLNRKVYASARSYFS